MENPVNTEKIRGYYEILVQNARAGASFRLKLHNDPVTYTVIPLITGNQENNPGGKFVYRVLEPPPYRGTFEKPVAEIEMLERKKN